MSTFTNLEAQLENRKSKYTIKRANRYGKFELHARAFVTCQFLDALGKLEDRVLLRVADVDRKRVVSVHQRHETIHQIADVLKRARLLAVAIHLHEHVLHMR